MIDCCDYLVICSIMQDSVVPGGKFNSYSMLFSLFISSCYGYTSDVQGCAYREWGGGGWGGGEEGALYSMINITKCPLL